MAKYRHDLQQLSSDLFLTDGGMETTLIFHERLELPDFAAFDLLKRDEGRKAIAGILTTEEPWLQRLGGIRANASSKSHAELDEAEELDDGNPVELGSQYRALRDRLNHLTVLAGCCGTDHRHVQEIAKACVG